MSETFWEDENLGLSAAPGHGCVSNMETQISIIYVARNPGSA